MKDKRITDLWFRTPLSLEQIAERLELTDVDVDSENYWEWVIGTAAGVRIDITRTHTVPAGTTDTRIFILTPEPPIRSFDADLIDHLVVRLRRFVEGPISCGRWIYLRGDDFDLVVVATR